MNQILSAFLIIFMPAGLARADVGDCAGAAVDLVTTAIQPIRSTSGPNKVQVVAKVKSYTRAAQGAEEFYVLEAQFLDAPEPNEWVSIQGPIVAHYNVGNEMGCQLQELTIPKQK